MDFKDSMKSLISDILQWTPHMDDQKQDDQQDPIHNSSVPIQNVTLKTCRERWTIETGGERGSVRPILAAQHDDDDDDDEKEHSLSAWIGPMKDGEHGEHLLDNITIITKKWVTSSDVDFYRCSLSLTKLNSSCPHCLEYTKLIHCREVRTPSQKIRGALGIILNCIRWWIFISEDLETMDHSYIAITFRYSLTRSGSTC